MRRINSLIICFLITNFCIGQVKLENELDTLSYALGANIGDNIRKGGVSAINIAAFNDAFIKALAKDSVLFSLIEQKKIIQAYWEKTYKKQVDINLKEGEEFLANNKTKKGVITTESGLQYLIILAGTGNKPKETDKVKVNYKGTLLDGTVFDSSYDRGEAASFPVNKVIKGWQEVLQLMPVGSKWKVFVPSQLAYGQRNPKGSEIGPNMVLIFELELLGIE